MPTDDPRPPTQRWSRRTLLRAGLFAAAAGLPLVARGSFTPRQSEGPFFPKDPQDDTDADLTRIDGHADTATGQVIIVSGRVLDGDGSPVDNAIIDVWHANSYGRYNHPADRSSAPLDPHFQGWGRLATGTDGRYRFRTIAPGAYAASRDWQRPPHIHFKVRRSGYEDLTTQMYFSAEPLNETDRILQALSAADREKVIVGFSEQLDGVAAGRFDLVIRNTA